MFSKTYSGLVMGVDGIIVQVEADISDGLPMFTMVGYLSSSVKESAERVRTSLKNSGYYLPPKRITINLSPADIRKDGTVFDLAIAFSILQSVGIIQEDKLNNVLVLGELSLNGDVVPINGVLPIVHCALKSGIKRVVVPQANEKEARLIKDIRIIGVNNLTDAVSLINEGIFESCIDEQYDKSRYTKEVLDNDFCNVRGQQSLKRGMEIAASGFHNIILSGVAGSGKSMVAKCLPGIMPPLSFEESIEITKIYSITGMLNNSHLITRRPFRTIHHSITKNGLIGGGNIPRPGEVTLAHNGVLFLDELTEFPKTTLELLRQPIEDRKICISRVNSKYIFPSDFMLVSATNPCPCGMYPDRSKCQCSINQIKRYQAKISQALLDRIDINIEVNPVKFDEIFSDIKEETSTLIQERVMKATEIQEKRYREIGLHFNSQLTTKQIEQYIKLDFDVEDALKDVFKSGNISARGVFRILKLSRTIADLDNVDKISKSHLYEALFFRNSKSEIKEV